MKARRTVLLALAAVLAASALVVAVQGPAIFQRGNPIPYFVATLQIADDRPFAYVGEEEGREVYIAERESDEAIIDHVAKERGLDFMEQAGAGFIFSDGRNQIIAQTEVYWGRWTVWEIPPLS